MSDREERMVEWRKRHIYMPISEKAETELATARDYHHLTEREECNVLRRACDMASSGYNDEIRDVHITSQVRYMVDERFRRGFRDGVSQLLNDARQSIFDGERQLYAIRQLYERDGLAFDTAPYINRIRELLDDLAAEYDKWEVAHSDRRE